MSAIFEQQSPDEPVNGGPPKIHTIITKQIQICFRSQLWQQLRIFAEIQTADLLGRGVTLQTLMFAGSTVKFGSVHV